MATTAGAQIGLKKIEAAINELAEQVDATKFNETVQNWLAFNASFYHYSFMNTLNIWLQMPTATLVGGAGNCWKPKGRRPIKGAKIVWVLAPIIVGKDKNDPGNKGKLVGFCSRPAYDVSQTEGAPLPDAPCWWTDEKLPELFQALEKVAFDMGVTVEEDALFMEKNSGARGVSMGGSVVLDTAAGTKTLVHELAHEIQRKEGLSSDCAQRETEAEAVAYVVTTHFGGTVESSANYIALKGADSAILRKRLSVIAKMAQHLIEAVQAELPKIVTEDNSDYYEVTNTFADRAIGYTDEDEDDEDL